jgi:hypothetical protein
MLPALGLGTTDHNAPSQTSINASVAEPVFVFPTATHHDVDTHETDRSQSSMLPALGLGTTDHNAPSQTSINASVAEPVFVFPTATHHDVDTHETEYKASS